MTQIALAVGTFPSRNERIFPYSIFRGKVYVDMVDTVPKWFSVEGLLQTFDWISLPAGHGFLRALPERISLQQLCVTVLPAGARLVPATAWHRHSGAQAQQPLCPPTAPAPRVPSFPAKLMHF